MDLDGAMRRHQSSGRAQLLELLPAGFGGVLLNLPFLAYYRHVDQRKSCDNRKYY
jgi:hypothetical protein